jgi:hypothetical protein
MEKGAVFGEWADRARVPTAECGSWGGREAQVTSQCPTRLAHGAQSCPLFHVLVPINLEGRGCFSCSSMLAASQFAFGH